MRPALPRFIFLTLLTLALATLLLAVPAALAQSSSPNARFMLLPTTSLHLHTQDGHTVNAHVELATTPESQALGLMYRQHLPANQGMLFVFERAAGCFYMRNTRLPLSIAFIDAQGIIQQINHMEPLSEALHCPGPGLVAPYALEMNAGWFERNHLRTGDRASGLPGLSR